MTVCIAGLFDWAYGKVSEGRDPDLGRSAILISDRMITAGDVQYEPQQRKSAQISPNCLIAIAGDFGIHSQAIKDTFAQLRGNTEPHPHDVAVMYGRAIQALKRRQAEDLYLAPLGLNTDSFIAQQKEMSDGMTNALLERMQSHRGDDVEAIVVGTSQLQGANKPAAQIYTVDTSGSVSCADDVGFAAIGIGAWHARSRLMQYGYTNNSYFAPALASLYAAKRAAEIAPGVGSATDIQLLLRDGTSPLREQTHKDLHKLYGQYITDRQAMELQLVHRLNESIGKTGEESTPNAEAQPTGSDVQTDGGTGSATTETAREDEAGPGKAG